MKRTKTIKNILALGTLLTFSIIPDFIYSQFNPSYLVTLNTKNISVSTLLMLLLFFSRTPKINLTILALFTLFQSTQLMYFHYYGTFYSGFDIILMLREMADALSGFIDVFSFLVWPLLLSLAFAIPAVIVYHKYSNSIRSSYWVTPLLILVLVTPTIQAINSNTSQKFQPNISHPAIKNGLYAFSYFISYQIKKILGIQSDITHYEDYQTHVTSTSHANVVIIMGESLSYLNMGLFDYERDTTPNLDKLKTDSSFIFKPSISSAVSTRVSLSLFFNTVYEPDNITHLSKMDTSLFKLAKQSGYNTHYISTQNNAGGLTYSFSPSDIDTWKDNSNLQHYDNDFDRRLLLELESMNLNYSEPQFITLHMRSTHTPYVDNYPAETGHYPVKNQNYANYMRNSYDNSVHYTEKLTTEIFQFFKGTNKPTYIFFTSDHGELTGQSGRFGR